MKKLKIQSKLFKKIIDKLITVLALLFTVFFGLIIISAIGALNMNIAIWTAVIFGSALIGGLSILGIDIAIKFILNKLIKKQK